MSNLEESRATACSSMARLSTAAGAAPPAPFEAAVLKDAIGQVAFAAAQDESRPVLAGVLLKLEAGRLTLAAADGFRLAVRTVELPPGADQELSIIVPARSLTELARVLSDDEIRVLWPMLDEAGTFGALVKTLLLTAQRRDEVAHMSRAEIGKDGIWTVPAERYKTKKPNFVPLSEAALALVDAQPKVDGCDYVFPSRAGTPFSAFGKSKAALDKAALAAMQRRATKGTKVAPLPNWTLHDLRRTGKTLMA